MVVKNYESSSDDEAPEEDSFTSSAAQMLQRARDLKSLRNADKKSSKDKRRARDSALKQQTEKRRLLSEVLNEQEEDSDDEPLPKQPTPIKVVAGRHRRLESEKDGFKLKVVKKVVKKLPPPKSALADRRERFLFRKSVPRR